MNLTEIRDELVNLKDILHVSRLALLNGDIRGPDAVSIANILYFHVIQKLEMLDDELKKINQGE